MNPALAGILMAVLGLGSMAVGAAFIYAFGLCTRCGHWSMKYECPNCRRGRYDYIP